MTCVKILKETHTFEVGDIVSVTLTLTTEGARDYVVVNDPVPSGLEVIDTRLKTVALSQRTHSRPNWWSDFDHIELRSDRVLLFADQLSPGVYTFTYLARATTAGKFVRVGARVEEMYQPNISGRSDGGVLWIYPQQD